MRDKKSEAKVSRQSNHSLFFTPTQPYTWSFRTTSALSQQNSNLLKYCILPFIRRIWQKNPYFIAGPIESVSQAERFLPSASFILHSTMWDMYSTMWNVHSTMLNIHSTPWNTKADTLNTDRKRMKTGIQLPENAIRTHLQQTSQGLVPNQHMINSCSSEDRSFR